MITNLIYFLYDIRVDYLRKNKDSYIFLFNNSFYILKKTTNSEENLLFLSNFMGINSKFHTLLKNRYSKFLSKVNDEHYVLMKVKFNTNRLVSLNDIYNNDVVSYINKDNFNWIKFWKKKIDQVEFFLNNYNIDIYSLSIINYFLSLSELAISYFNENVKNNYFPVVFCHKRITKDFDLYDYFSITDVVLDHYIRDISELLKSYIYCSNEINLDDFKLLINIKDKDLLISRLLFPSYFFDVMDEIIINNRGFDNFFMYFVDFDIYKKNLEKVIDFLK